MNRAVSTGRCACTARQIGLVAAIEDLPWYEPLLMICTLWLLTWQWKRYPLPIYREFCNQNPCTQVACLLARGFSGLYHPWSGRLAHCFLSASGGTKSTPFLPQGTLDWQSYDLELVPDWTTNFVISHEDIDIIRYNVGKTMPSAPSPSHNNT